MININKERKNRILWRLGGLHFSKSCSFLPQIDDLTLLKASFLLPSQRMSYRPLLASKWKKWMMSNSLLFKTCKTLIKCKTLPIYNPNRLGLHFARKDEIAHFYRWLLSQEATSHALGSSLATFLSLETTRDRKWWCTWFWFGSFFLLVTTRNRKWQDALFPMSLDFKNTPKKPLNSCHNLEQAHLHKLENIKNTWIYSRMWHIR